MVPAHPVAVAAARERPHNACVSGRPDLRPRAGPPYAVLMALAPGDKLGPYELISSIGKGGMGEVYRARDTRLGRVVAIKVLHSHATAAGDLRQRFEREARAVGALNDPHICTLYDIGRDGDIDYLVMEYLEGRTLADVVSEGPLPPDRVLNYAREIALALGAAHARGVIHRDLKPANLFVLTSGSIKVLDFGISKQTLDSEADLTISATQPGVFEGTVGYSSPEQLRSEPVDERSDLFSLGAVLWELLSGRPPFVRPSVVDAVSAILNDEPDPLPSDVPMLLAFAVTRCLAKRPEDRFVSAPELLRFLDATSRQALHKAPSIAVLPFADLSQARDQEYLCDGIAEELITSLMSLEGVRVASRSSAFQFKGRAESVTEIGRRLKVSNVLEGSVRRAGNRLRFTVQLTDVSEGFQVWSERYDREMDDVFAVQDEIAHAVVSQLKVALARPEAPLVVRATTNMEAYNLYLMGRHLILKWTQDGMTRGMEALKAAITKQPDYADAHAALAYGYLLHSFSYLPPRQVMPLAKSAAERSLQLNPNLAAGHLVLGCVRQWYDWDLEGAEAAFRRALELSPGDAIVSFNHAELLLCRGRFDEATAEAVRAIERDPLSPMVSRSLGDALYAAGRFNDAVAHSNKMIDLEPAFFSTYWILGLSLAALGHLAGAIEALERGRAVAYGDPETEAFLGWALALAGERDRASEILRQLEARRASGFVSASSIGLVCQGLGRMDEAIEWYRQAVADRSGACLSFQHQHFAAARQDPRFVALIETVKGGSASSR